MVMSSRILAVSAELLKTWDMWEGLEGVHSDFICVMLFCFRGKRGFRFLLKNVSGVNKICICTYVYFVNVSGGRMK